MKKTKLLKKLTLLPVLVVPLVAAGCHKSSLTLQDIEYKNAGALLSQYMTTMKWMLKTINIGAPTYTIKFHNNDKNATQYFKDHAKLVKNSTGDVLSLIVNDSTPAFATATLSTTSPSATPKPLITNSIDLFFNFTFNFTKAGGVITSGNKASTFTLDPILCSASYLTKVTLIKAAEANQKVANTYSTAFINNVKTNGIKNYYSALTNANFLNKIPKTDPYKYVNNGSSVDLSKFNFVKSNDKDVKLAFNFTWLVTFNTDKNASFLLDSFTLSI